MKSIVEHVREGIHSLADLKDALQTAMRLEFSTLPPYLCAQWSIDDDPSKVALMIQNIAIEEMMHFALAGNMLNAIGQSPDIANAAFIPKYPTDTLPGGIHLHREVDLKPLSRDQVRVFMEIEKPEFKPVALALEKRPATIGAFYDTIAVGLTNVKPSINQSAAYVQINEMAPPYNPIANPSKGQILTLADAQAAIERIKHEGEGTEGDPNQPPDDVQSGQTFAHYYIFKEIHDGKTLQLGPDGHWQFGNPPIQFPTVYAFAKSNKQPDPSAQFEQALASLLTQLQTCWTQGAAPDEDAMEQLKSAGKTLIKQGVQPEFVWPVISALSAKV